MTNIEPNLLNATQPDGPEDLFRDREFKDASERSLHMLAVHEFEQNGPSYA